MTSSHSIRELARRSLVDLDFAHDYYVFSKRSWDLIDIFVENGRAFRLYNPVTGTRVNQTRLSTLSERYVQEFLPSAALQHAVSIFENYIFGLIRLWLTDHPKSLSKKQLEFGDVLNAANFEELTQLIVDRELNQLKFDRVSKWFDYLNRLVNLGIEWSTTVEQLSEMKASRDVLVHNGGIVNATYIQKSGKLCRHRLGEQIVLDAAYLRDSWQLLKSLINDLAEATAAKADTTTG